MATASTAKVASIESLVDERTLAPSGVAQFEKPSENMAIPVRRLQLTVVWGDVTKVPADIHVVGHYQGVLPSSTEQAIDRAISADQREIIAEHTRRGWLVGTLGEIQYFPGVESDEGSTVQKVAVAGMGRPGTFNEHRAAQFYASVLRELFALPSVKKAALVAIGAGAGNLSMSQTTRAMLDGFRQALRDSAAASASAITDIVIIDKDRLRADQLRKEIADATVATPELMVSDQVKHEGGGDVSLASAAALAVSALARLAREDTQNSSPVLQALPAELRNQVWSRLADMPDDLRALVIQVGLRLTEDSSEAPTRISVLEDRNSLRWAAITDRATMPERDVAVNRTLIEQLVDRLTPPKGRDAQDLPQMLTRFVVPVDFQELLNVDAPIILELDRWTARLPWEFLTDHPVAARLWQADGTSGEPLAVRRPISRQLRTNYSRVAEEEEERDALSALVIADPRGDLPEARAEGNSVVETLRAANVHVTSFIGPSDGPARGATELNVLNELLTRDYDIVHFAGHGAFDPSGRGGWLLADQLFTAADLSQLSRAPRLVLANACWSSKLRANRSPQVMETPSEYSVDPKMLTPVIADEFLRAGAVHYLGTSWEVPDDLAMRFSTTFYAVLLGTSKTSPQSPQTVGRALCDAREVVFHSRGRADPVDGQRWSAWAAYQHYGDPCDHIIRAKS